MNQNRGMRFLPLLITLVIIVVVIVVIVSIGRALLSGGTTASTDETDATRKVLLNTDDTRSVAMIVRGPIVAQENFRSYKIEVSPSTRAMDVYRGYLDKRVRGDYLTNNEKAYAQFVNALDKANMTHERRAEVSDNLLGICATGYVYEFELLNNGDVEKMLWTSTCSGSKGSLNASKDQLANLFLEQIPSSEELSPFTSSPQLGF